MKISLKSLSLAVIASALTLLGSACGSSGNGDKKDLNQLLADNDFAGANEYLIQRFDEANRYGGTSLDTKYILPATKVLKAEATYLMDTDDPEAEKVYKMMKPNYTENQELKEGASSAWVSSYIWTYTSNDAQREEAKALIDDYEAEH